MLFGSYSGGRYTHIHITYIKISLSEGENESESECCALSFLDVKSSRRVRARDPYMWAWAVIVHCWISQSFMGDGDFEE